MKNLSKREFTMIIALAVIIIFAAYYNFFFSSFLDENATLDADITSTRSLVNDAKLKSAAIQQTEQKIEQINIQIDEFSENILPGLDRPEIIRMLDRAVYPFITGSQITFVTSYTDLGSNYIFTVSMSFSSLLEDYPTILSNLQNESIINRVINSSLAITDLETGAITVRIDMEVLTQNNPMVSFKTENIPVEE